MTRNSICFVIRFVILSFIFYWVSEKSVERGRDCISYDTIESKIFWLQGMVFSRRLNELKEDKASIRGKTSDDTVGESNPSIIRGKHKFSGGSTKL